jgi:hypothetical protein
MIFKNFKDAHEYLYLDGPSEQLVIGSIESGIACIKIIDHPNSYNEFFEDYKYISCVGVGKQKTPGHPTLNQNGLEQRPFFISNVSHNCFPVLFKTHDENVHLLGYYNISNIEKTMSPSGFTYFMIKLVRQY